MFILIMSRYRGTGTCQHAWKFGMHDKWEGLQQTCKKFIIGDVVTLRAAGTHKRGVDDIRDR
jgi:hypothetical protein